MGCVRADESKTLIKIESTGKVSAGYRTLIKIEIGIEVGARSKTLVKIETTPEGQLSLL